MSDLLARARAKIALLRKELAEWEAFERKAMLLNVEDAPASAPVDAGRAFQVFRDIEEELAEQEDPERAREAGQHHAQRVVHQAEGPHHQELRDEQHGVRDHHRSEQGREEEVASREPHREDCIGL